MNLYLGRSQHSSNISSDPYTFIGVSPPRGVTCKMPQIRIVPIVCQAYEYRASHLGKHALSFG